MTSPIVINVPNRALLPGETKGYFFWCMANLNIKRKLTSMFVNKYPPYIPLPKNGRLLVTRVYFIIRYAKKKKQEGSPTKLINRSQVSYKCSSIS